MGDRRAAVRVVAERPARRRIHYDHSSRRQAVRLIALQPRCCIRVDHGVDCVDLDAENTVEVGEGIEGAIH